MDHFWAKIFDNITPHPDIPVASAGQIAWAMRKNNPQLKALVDEFIQTHAAGTSFGNVELQRYLRNTKWVKNSTSTAEMQKFQTNLDFFKKYSGQYNFDYLMIAAQAYQESQLDQTLDPVNRTLFTFAAYNAGPNRIVRLRQEAQQQGLDPNQWFGNVELVASKDIGQETVQYVSNIYKYYIAYKLSLQQTEALQKAKAAEVK